MIKHVQFHDLWLTQAESYVVHVSLGFSYDCFFLNFFFKRFIHFSALGLSKFCCVYEEFEIMAETYWCLAGGG